MTDYFGGQQDSIKDATNREIELEKQRTGCVPIDFQLNDVNFDHLRRKRAFYKNVDITVTQSGD